MQQQRVVTGAEVGAGGDARGGERIAAADDADDDDDGDADSRRRRNVGSNNGSVLRRPLLIGLACPEQMVEQIPTGACGSNQARDGCYVKPIPCVDSLCLCGYACVRACVCVCVRACVRAYVCVCAYVRPCVRAVAEAWDYGLDCLVLPDEVR